MKEATPVEIVVDLLEIKARSDRPFSASELESGLYNRAHFNYQYAVISHAVVMICDKYSVRSGDIEEEISKRSHNKIMEWILSKHKE